MTIARDRPSVGFRGPEPDKVEFLTRQRLDVDRVGEARVFTPFIEQRRRVLLNHDMTSVLLPPKGRRRRSRRVAGLYGEDQSLAVLTTREVGARPRR